MASIFSGLKAAALWEDLQLPSRKMKRELFLREALIRVNYLYVIGQHVQQMMQEAKIKPLLATGIKKEATVQLLP